jgi:hypothetical protein
MDFYWFVSRSLQALQSPTCIPSMTPEYQTFFNQIENSLKKSLQTFGTDFILQSAQISEDDQFATWDDFLGNNDTTIFGYTVQYHEDRVFTTSGIIHQKFQLNLCVSGFASIIRYLD